MHVYVCICMYVYVCMFVCVYMYVCMYACMCMFVYAYMCMYVCITYGGNCPGGNVLPKTGGGIVRWGNCPGELSRGELSYIRIIQWLDLACLHVRLFQGKESSMQVHRTCESHVTLYYTTMLHVCNLLEFRNRFT